MLGKKQLAGLFYFKNAAAAFDQLDLAVWKTLLDFRLQTGGAREVVSNAAVFDREFHARISLKNQTQKNFKSFFPTD